MNALRCLVFDPMPRHRRYPDRVPAPCYCRVAGTCVTCARWARTIKAVMEWRITLRRAGP